MAAVAAELDRSVEYISDLSELPDMLDSAEAFVIGGTEWPAADGGRETDLGLVAVDSYYYSAIADPQIITVKWPGNVQRAIYYQYGPAFVASELPAGSKILAYYDGKPYNAKVTVAAFVAASSSGRIVPCGPHPEGDETWLDDTPAPLNAGLWTAGYSTQDLGVALFKELLAP